MPATLAQKLQIKPAITLLVLNAPAGRLDELARLLPDNPVRAAGEPPGPAVLLFVNNLAEARRLAPDAIRSIAAGGLLWMAYPKGSSGVKTDVNRDRLWEAILPLGWQAVRQIAIDDVWSALRFRPAADVGR